MRMFSSYCRTSQGCISISDDLDALSATGERTIEILGYSDGRKSPQNLFPRFTTILHEKTPKNLSIIRERREDIRRVLRKIELSRDQEYQADFVEKALSWMGMPQIKDDKRRKFKFKYGIDLNSPSEEELEKIILNWKSDSNSSDSSWENLGFQLDGESNVRWIDSFVASEPFLFEIRRINEELVDIDSLINLLSNYRSDILNVLGMSPIKTVSSAELDSHETQRSPQNKTAVPSSD